MKSLLAGGATPHRLDSAAGKWSPSGMSDSGFPITRRGLLAGLGGSGVGLALPAAAVAQQRPSLVLQARPGAIALRPGEPDTTVVMLQRAGAQPLRFDRGDEVAVRFENQLSQPLILNWQGLGGAPNAEPLSMRQPVPPGGKDEFALPLRHAGTLFADVRLLGDGEAGAMPALPLIVAESETIAVDRDELILIEDWRLASDGRVLPPGAEARDATSRYTINGKVALDLSVRTHQRLRFRFINACQRNMIAIKINDHEVRVMALDGQPSEPFLARNGMLVLAPGTRVDAFVDATQPAGSTAAISLLDGGETRPLARLVYSGEPPLREAPLPLPAALPSNGLPAQLDLKGALRVDLALGADPAWSRPIGFAAGAAPAFQVKRGRTVVLALANRAAVRAVFHLHGHHFRLLDRLDDGWKPFWLDTLAIDAGQTQRVAFAAEFAGLWLMQAMAAEWASPRLLRSYAVI
jgi:FtsP/CotA-like multicopper oxidase with cupredoxin domain